MTNLDEEWLFTLDFHVNQDIFLKIYNHLHLGLLLTLVFQMKISLVLYMGGETGCNCLMAFISFKDNFENHRRFDRVVYWTFAHQCLIAFITPELINHTYCFFSSLLHSRVVSIGGAGSAMAPPFFQGTQKKYMIYNISLRIGKHEQICSIPLLWEPCYSPAFWLNN